MINITIREGEDFEAVRKRVAAEVSNLIQNDFQELIRLLYRVDVDENKLKFLLKEKVQDDASVIIADLLIERQLQKIATRKAFRQPPPEDAEESW